MRLINRKPGRPLAVFLAMLPFAVLLVAYMVASEIRLAANPSDRLLPAPGTIADTALGLLRLGLGVGIASLTGLIVGLAIGLLPHMRAALGTFVAVVSMIPPLAILPILFITFGLGEVSKVLKSAARKQAGCVTRRWAESCCSPW